MLIEFMLDRWSSIFVLFIASFLIPFVVIRFACKHFIKHINPRYPELIALIIALIVLYLGSHFVN